MRILHVGMGWFGEEFGGLSRVMSQAVSAQAEAGLQARGLVTGTDLARRLSGGLVEPFARGDQSLARRLWAARRAVARSLDEFRPDVVSCHFALYARPSVGLLGRRQVPWVMHFHGPWALEGRAEGGKALVGALKKIFVEAPVYSRASRLITLSQAFARILEEEFGVAPERIRVVPGGFDPRPFSAAPGKREARSRLGLPQDRPVVVCLRRLQSRMGLENLVEAATILRRAHPDILVAIAGKGPLAPALRQRIEDAGLENNVRLMGFVADEDLGAFYAAGDLSVVPTVALEGFGLIVAESLASGTPVVATKVGALPELIFGLSPGLLADPTPAGLAEILDGALSGRIEVPSAERCRAHSMAWSWEQVVPRLVSVYREAMGA